MFTLRLLPKQRIVKFDRQLPISNWAYPFHRETDLNKDRLAAYAIANTGKSRRRAVYIHVPFCETICSFCPFRRDKYRSDADVDEYLTALITELDLKRQFLGRCKVDAIFVGGGTPSLLSARQINALGEAIVRNFDVDALREFTFEVEVKSVTEEKLQAMHDIGVNRVSFGAQTFSEQYRALFSLDASLGEISDAAALLTAMFPYTNVDLLYGMAGQNAGGLRNDLMAAVNLRTTTIDVYPINNLAASRSMHAAMAGAKLTLLPATSRVQFRLYLDDWFRELGYAPISGYGYAVAGDAGNEQPGPVQNVRKFLYHDIFYGYDDDEILGYGSSALSQMPGFNLYNLDNRRAYVSELVEKRELPHLCFGPIAAPERGVVSFPYRGTLEKSRIEWDKVPDDTLMALRRALDAELIADHGENYGLTKVGWLFYVNLMYYLMPEPGKEWISGLIERQQQLGRSCENTALTELIYSSIGI
jgi:oxygen-independent coproporphyrinogen-3 oxidase